MAKAYAATPGHTLVEAVDDELGQEKAAKERERVSEAETGSASEEVQLLGMMLHGGAGPNSFIGAGEQSISALRRRLRGVG